MPIRLKAVDVLGGMRAKDAVGPLVQQLFMRDTETTTKQHILVALGKIGDARATKPIVDFLARDGDRGLRGNAIFALGDIGDQDALGPLKRIADESTDRRCAPWHRRRCTRSTPAQGPSWFLRRSPPIVVATAVPQARRRSTPHARWYAARTGALAPLCAARYERGALVSPATRTGPEMLLQGLGDEGTKKAALFEAAQTYPSPQVLGYAGVQVDEGLGARVAGGCGTAARCHGRSSCCRR